MRESRAGRRVFATLSIGTALAALIAGTPASAQQVSSPPAPLPTEGTGQASASSANADRTAQAEAAADNGGPASEIVVTGSSIRGVPPTGSNLIQLGAEEVINTGATTTQELLAQVPQLGTFNQAPRPDPHSNGILSTAPNIRGIGQAQTLVLLNGHRLVGVGHLQNIPDPSIIPPSAIQRVEIVADGASSVYGSDGIAGVVNIITRRDYDGLEVSGKYGVGDNYNSRNLNAVTGKRWTGGGVMVSAEYSATSRLQGFDRDFGITTNFAPRGGTDQRSINNCPVGGGLYRLNNAAGRPTDDYIQLNSGVHNPHCDLSQYTDLYPKQRRMSFFASGHQEINDRIEVYFDAFHSKAYSDANLGPAGSSGVITTANPFFPAALAAQGITSITSYYDVSAIDGVRLRDKQHVKVYGGTAGVDVKLPKGFEWSTYLTGSRSFTDLHEGSFSPVVNGASINATSAAIAIDPFGGQTSGATKIGLADYEQRYASHQYIWEANSKIDGALFHLPGGDAKIAVGGVYRKEYYNGINTLSRIGFLENLGAQIGRRTVYSGFGELFVPIFSQDNAIPLLRRLDLSLSARYDHYSDFGKTTNPKVGVNYSPVDGLTLRGSYGTSFHAPALPDLFGPDTRAGYGTGGLTPAGLATRTGNIFIAGGNPDLKPETAHTYSFGVDLAPPQIAGLRASLTYYNVAFKGRIAFPSSSFFYVDPSFNRFFVDNVVCNSGTYPSGTGCTSQPIDPNVVYNLIKGLRLQNFPRAVTGPADIPPIYIVTILRRQNLAEIDTEGLDFDVNYHWNMPFGTMGAQVQGNYVLVYDQRAIQGAPRVSQFPFGQVRLKTRGQLSLKSGPVTAVATVNYTGAYHSQYLMASGTSSVQSVERVKPFVSADLHLGYSLPDRGVLAGTELTLDAANLFDTNPPLLRSGNGYSTQADVLGRVIQFGIRKKF